MTHWHELIQGDPTRDAVEHFRIVSRRGAEFLVLPDQAALAVEALSLYSAQTTLARSARWSLQLLLKAGLSFGQKRMSLAVNRRDWLGAFFGHAPFAILCGNPAAKGRRFIFLSFEGSRPAKVAKAGLGEDAAQLILREAAFLRMAAGVPGIPRILDEREHGNLRSFCMEYLPGRSPQDSALIGATLGPWVRSGERRTITEFSAWQRVRQSDAPREMLAPVESALLSTPLSPALSHGDFAPWNIREHRGKWTVLDWERGETNGLPGWDWLHFHIQSNVLVRKMNAQQVFDRTIGMMQSQAFESYATAAGFSGLSRSILQSYLLHAIYVNRQTEGGETLKQMLAIANR